VNEIFGEAKNPHNPERSPAGSSGGEAGMVAAHCTPLGLGTDIGGSIRGPSAFCGVCGFKPTASRMSNDGIYLLGPDAAYFLASIKGVMGPIA